MPLTKKRREELEEEIEELRKEKAVLDKKVMKIKEGKNLIQRMGISIGARRSHLGRINKELKMKTQLLKGDLQLERLKQRSEATALNAKIQKEKEKLNEMRKKNFIKEEDIFGTEELFKI